MAIKTQGHWILHLTLEKKQQLYPYLPFYYNEKLSNIHRNFTNNEKKILSGASFKITIQIKHMAMLSYEPFCNPISPYPFLKVNNIM